MIARSATILGITVIGGLIASYVHINVVTSFAIDSTHSVALQQDFFDKVFPNILPMAYTLSSIKSSRIFYRWPTPC